MPSASLHLAQAQHNERLAQSLKQYPSYKDWTLTITFYAALHLEYKLASDTPPMHTRGNCPAGIPPHDWLEDKAQGLGRVAYSTYRHLRTQSEIARYLCSIRMRLDTGGVIACDYFRNGVVINAIDVRLQIFKSKISSIYPFP